jgi:hypothetical protein
MEAGGRIVGSVGNIFSSYEFNGRPVLAAAAHAVAVDPEYRKNSLPMLVRFFRQEKVDLLLSTTANEAASKVYTGFKAQRVPHPNYDQVLYWITGYTGFLRGGLSRRGKNPALAPFAAPLLWLADFPARKARASAARTRVLTDFDERFDTLWNQLRRTPDRLLAVRSRQALAWHFEEAKRHDRLAIVALQDGANLTGYLILLRRDATDIGLLRYQVADMQVLGANPAAVTSLVSAALQLARRQGIHVVEATGFDTFKHVTLEALRPRRRMSPSWPFLYKVQTADLIEPLSRPQAWDPCPYDGDAAF